MKTETNVRNSCETEPVLLTESEMQALQGGWGEKNCWVDPLAPVEIIEICPDISKVPGVPRRLTF